MTPRAYNFLRIAHRWLGVSVGAMFVLQGLTGAFLAFLPQFDRMINPQIAATYEPGTARSLPDIAESLWRERHDTHQGIGVGLIKGERRMVAAYWPMPNAQTGGFDFILARLNPGTGELLTQTRYGALPRNPLEVAPFVQAFHIDLTLGRLGRFAVIGMGVFLLLSIVLGFRLWWPGRTRLKAQLKPSSVSRRRWAQTLHRFVAPYAGVMIILLVITGIALQFEPQLDATQYLTSSPSAERPQISPLRAWVQAERVFPGAEPQDLGAPFSPMGVFRIKLLPVSGRLAGEQVELFIDNYSGEIVRIRSSQTMTGLEKTLSALTQLHGGAFFGTAGHVLAFLVGFMPVVLLVTGVRRWYEIRRAKRSGSRASRALAGRR